MPRGQVNYNLQLETINAKIDRHQAQIENLIAERDAIIVKKQAGEMKDIYKFISENGMSPSEALDKLKS